MGAPLWPSAGDCGLLQESAHRLERGRALILHTCPSSWLLVSFGFFVAHLSAEAQLSQLQEGMYPNLTV